MQNIIPRFEFRAFAQNFGIMEEKLRKFAEFKKFRESSEIYIFYWRSSEFSVWRLFWNKNETQFQ